MRKRKERESFLQRGLQPLKAAMLMPAAAGTATGDLEIWASGAAVVLGTCG